MYIQVGYVQQQRIVERVKKEYTPPTDPDWRRQWSLVCYVCVARIGTQSTPLVKDTLVLYSGSVLY